MSTINIANVTEIKTRGILTSAPNYPSFDKKSSNPPYPKAFKVDKVFLAASFTSYYDLTKKSVIRFIKLTRFISVNRRYRLLFTSRSRTLAYIFYTLFNFFFSPFNKEAWSHTSFITHFIIDCWEVAIASFNLASINNL